MSPPAPAKRRGRPTLPPDAGRTARVALRTTPERKAKAEQLAQAAGLTLSAWWERQVDRAKLA